MGKVIYLTGAPATGKSSLSARLAVHVPGLCVLSYSALLRDYISQRIGDTIDEVGIREKSARIVTREDVAAVDQWLIEEVRTKRDDQHIVIDSHPITKESFGFRITPFTLTQLKELNPDVVICAYAAPSVIADRIRKDAAGRPLPNNFDLALHIELQAMLATQYAFLLERNCYLLNSDAPLEELVQRFLILAKIN